MASSYQEGQVKIYDDLFNRKLAPSLEVQLAQLYGPATTDSSILVTGEAVQQQQGKTDCGLFSIAYAYCAESGEDISKPKVNQVQLRSQLTACFEQQVFTLSPLASVSNVVKSRKRHFCTVCMPCPSHFDSEMMFCEICQKWFHFKCMDIDTVPDGWVCASCK